MALLNVLVQPEIRDTATWQQADKMARHLLEHLETMAVVEGISAANRPGMSSFGIQTVIQPFLDELGFRSEARGLFADSVPRLRPDYFLPLPGDGLILEVERGKTIDNNMDLLDFWKTHICVHANFLFLLVPLSYQSNETMNSKSLFDTVYRRLATFFTPPTTRTSRVCGFLATDETISTVRPGLNFRLPNTKVATPSSGSRSTCGILSIRTSPS